MGCCLLRDWLGEVRSEVETEGALTESIIEKLGNRFGGKTNSLVSQPDRLRLKMEMARSGQNPSSLDGEKTETLAFLDSKINGFKNRREEHMEDELNENDARQAAAVLPSGKVLDKILRYETKLERQLYRAMAQLERVQRLRNGEAVPAPLSVQISERG